MFETRDFLKHQHIHPLQELRFTTDAEHINIRTVKERNEALRQDEEHLSDINNEGKSLPKKMLFKLPALQTTNKYKTPTMLTVRMINYSTNEFCLRT